MLRKSNMVYGDLTIKNAVAGKTMTIMPKILVADDEEFNLDNISFYLTDAGYDVIGAEGGSIALERLKNSEQVDVIVLEADITKFCADAPNERGAIAKCLESHASELEQACADAVKSRPGAKKA
jgi:hypothetical protein